MAINLMSVKPHKVSRDLSGYIIYIYGPAKSGKTTFATRPEGSLLLAAEKGYNALPNIYPVDITSWSEVKAVCRELKKPEVKDRFKNVIMDTIDLMGIMCEKFVCAQNGVEKIGEIPYGQGWNAMKREFEDTCRTITQLGYSLIFISHDKDRLIKVDEKEILQTFPSCPTTFNDIAKNMADVYGYTQKYKADNGTPQVRLVIRSQDGNIDCGSRFKYIDSSIDFTYASLVDAVNRAIDKEAEMNGKDSVTDAREPAVQKEELDYDALLARFNNDAAILMKLDKAKYAPKITMVVNKYLGKGKKVSDTTPEQAEVLKAIVDEIESEYLNK